MRGKQSIDIDGQRVEFWVRRRAGGEANELMARSADWSGVVAEVPARSTGSSFSPESLVRLYRDARDSPPVEP